MRPAKSASRAVMVAIVSGLVGATSCGPGVASSPEAQAPAELETGARPAAREAGVAPVVATVSAAVALLPAASSPPPALPPVHVVFPPTPKPIAPVHGATHWTVFLGLAPSVEALEPLAAAWVATKLPMNRGQGCHQGKGAPGDEEHFIAAYFKREKDARAFASASSPPVARVAQVKVFCLD